MGGKMAALCFYLGIGEETWLQRDWINKYQMAKKIKPSRRTNRNTFMVFKWLNHLFVCLWRYRRHSKIWILDWQTSLFQNNGKGSGQEHDKNCSVPTHREWEIGYKQIISYFIGVSASQIFAEQNWSTLQVHFRSKSQMKPKTGKGVS